MHQSMNAVESPVAARSSAIATYPPRTLSDIGVRFERCGTRVGDRRIDGSLDTSEASLRCSGRRKLAPRTPNQRINRRHQIQWTHIVEPVVPDRSHYRLSPAGWRTAKRMKHRRNLGRAIAVGSEIAFVVMRCHRFGCTAERPHRGIADLLGTNPGTNRMGTSFIASEGTPPGMQFSLDRCLCVEGAA